MPLHKSTRGPRLDPTMISAPLGDFRHTMHIGRGGDAFGDTSFLSSHGPSPPSSDPEAAGDLPAADADLTPNHSDSAVDGSNSKLQHSDSVSSFTMDLDLGPSILGDVLGVMDGLGLDSDWTVTNDEEVFSSNKDASVKEEQLSAVEEESVCVKNEWNEKQVGGDEDDVEERGEVCIMEGNGSKSKGLKPKVRFSDKREEIIRQASEEEGQGFEFNDEEGPESVSPTAAEQEKGDGPVVSVPEATNHKSDLPPSPASSHSSEYEGVTPLDRRRAENCHSETDSEEEEEEGGDSGRGYTFEDEFDDEIGL